MSATVRLDIGQATDVGRVRTSNEDSMLVLAPEGAVTMAVVAVADGMGGHNAGEVASALAVEAVEHELSEPDGTADAARLVREAVVRANRDIWRAAQRDHAHSGMGTTLVCALIQPSGAAVVANVGDSRAYVHLNGETRQLTEDHSWVAEQVRSGRMSETEAEMSPYRNILSRSLGLANDVEVDTFADVKLAMGDALVLCSDGVTSYLGAADIGRVLREESSAQAAAERMVRQAVASGGHDNATVVVARVVG